MVCALLEKRAKRCREKRHQETPRVNHPCFSGTGVSPLKGSALKAHQAGTEELLERKA